MENPKGGFGEGEKTDDDGGLALNVCVFLFIILLENDLKQIQVV